MVDKKTVSGKKKGDVLLYALSTCVWCKKTRALLEDLGVEYSYIYVDLLEDEEADLVKKEVEKWNPSFSFPTIVLDNKKCIVGFDEHKIKETLK